MPVDVIQSVFSPSQGQETLLMIDDYGSAAVLQIQVAHLADRAAMIASQQALMAANQTQTEAYAKAAGQDLTAYRLADVAAKIAFWNAQHPQSPIPVADPPTTTAPQVTGAANA